MYVFRASMSSMCCHAFIASSVFFVDSELFLVFLGCVYALSIVLWISSLVVAHANCAYL